MRQLLLANAIMTGLLLIGTQTLGVGAAYRALQEQLKQQSDSGATALVWILSRNPSPPPDEWSKLAAEFYNRGAYRYVRITDTQRNQSIEWGDEPVPGYDAPGWLRLWLPTKSSEITRSFASADGLHAGTVTIRAKDDQAMQALAQRSARMTVFILLAGALWVLFSIGLVHWLEKRILSNLSKRARALGRADFQTEGPSVLELEDVAQALADAQRQVLATTQKQTAQIELLQGEIYRDQVTRLYNRRYFIEQLKLALNAGVHTMGIGGHILMFRQRDLAEINRHTPRALTDQWLRSSSDQLNRLVREHGGSGAFLARLNGSDFAILLPRISAPQAALLTERVRHELRALRLPMHERSWCRWALAFAPYEPGETIHDIMGRLDHALMCAENADNDVIVPATQLPDKTTIGEYSWHNALITALDQHRFSLSTKTVQAIDGRLLHTEASLTLHDPDTAEPVPATLFIPPAVRLGLAIECDIQAVRLGLDWLVGHSEKLALKLSPSSLIQPGFLHRLEQMLRDRPSLSVRLILEIDAHELTDHYSDVSKFCEAVTNAEASVGIGQLNQSFGVIEHLHELPLSYLKIGGEFIQAVSQSPGSLQIANTIVEIATSLNIDVYAEDVPDASTQTLLQQIGIRVMQGPGINHVHNRHHKGT